MRHFALTFYLLFCVVLLFAQAPTIQDCLGAIPITQLTYTESQVPNSMGNFPNEINPTKSCLDDERSGVWYSFTAEADGNFGFLLTPNAIIDDYDWSVFDITNADCADIYNDELLVISCNSAGSEPPSITCNRMTGANGSTPYNMQGKGCNNPNPNIRQGQTPYNNFISVQAGHEYVFFLSNWSESLRGYTLDFSLSDSNIGLLKDCSDYTADVSIFQDFVVIESFDCPTNNERYFAGTELSFSIFSGDYPYDENTAFTYTWDFGDGTTSTTEFPEYAYTEPGIYTIRASMQDQEGCSPINELILDLEIVASPEIILPDNELRVCIGERTDLSISNDITEVADIYILPPSQTATGLVYNEYSLNPQLIPDGDALNAYEDVIVVNQFGNNQTFQNTSDLENINIVFEHSRASDIAVELICPDGRSITLKNFGGAPINAGEPYTDLDGSNDDSNPISGCAYSYFWNNGGSGILTWESSSVFSTMNSLAAGTYRSDETFANLIGCPLNGEWRLRVIDILPSENGFIFSWGMNFNPNLLPNGARVTSEIEYTWTGDAVIAQSPNSLSILTQESGVEVFLDVRASNGALSSETFTTVANPNCNVNECRMRDSLALVDLYNATNGQNWTNRWNLNEPMDRWYGVTLSSEGCVVCLDLDGSEELCNNQISVDGNNLDGVLPPTIGSFAELTRLSLAYNNLRGNLPKEIGNLNSLVYLNLMENNLSGRIPDEIGNLSNLESMWIPSNEFIGSIPPSIGNLNNLKDLQLSKNNLEGSIPKEIGRISTLNILFLWENNLSGSLPDELGNLSSLVYLNLRNNILSGSIPAGLYNLSNIRGVKLENNNLEGCFPEESSTICNLGPSSNFNNDGYNFTGNPKLPWQGDFQRFCNGENQIGASCNDGNIATSNDTINANCECTGEIGCPTIAPPQSIANSISICEGESIPPLQVSTAGVNSQSEIRWYTTVAGNSAIATGASLITNIEGTYYAEIYNTATECTSSRTAITLTINNSPTASISGDISVCPDETTILIASGGGTYRWSNFAQSNQVNVGVGTYTVTITNTDGCSAIATQIVTESLFPSINLISSECSDNLETYSISFTTEIGNNVTSSFGSVSINGNNFAISSIPESQNVVITITNTDSCQTIQSFTAPSCGCPTVSAPQAINRTVESCSNESYQLQVSSSGVNNESEVRWYNVPTGGLPIGTGFSFTPSVAGMYYAEIYNTLTNCQSLRTAITLNITVVGDSCNDGNDDTTGDTYNENCECVGTIIENCPDDPIMTPLEITICEGQNFTVGNSTYTTSDIYTNFFKTAEDCDSIVTLNLTVVPIFSTCPQDITILVAPSQNSTTVYWTPPRTTDDCAFSLSETHTPNSVFLVGTTTVTYTATFGDDTSTTCTFDVNVEQNTLSPTIQDCLGAIEISSYVYDEMQVPDGMGNYPDEINTTISCMADERNGIWYTFTPQNSGEFGFVLTPNDLVDDFDWSLFDITDANCSDIANNPDLLISCNAAGSLSEEPICNGETGANDATDYDVQGAGCGNTPPTLNSGESPFNAKADVVAGNTYALFISNWTQSPNGYTIDFSPSDDLGIFDVEVNECRMRDSLILVDLYNSTNGTRWRYDSNTSNTCSPFTDLQANNFDSPWLGRPISDWHGVELNEDGCVEKLLLCSTNMMFGDLPESLGQLEALTHLVITNRNLDSEIPTEIGNLSNLKVLALGGLKGTIPTELSQLENLERLSLTGDLIGQIPSSLEQLSKLEYLRLNGNLSGSIPIELGRLNELEQLWLDRNQLSGSIPIELGRLNELEQLWLDRNQLSGSIPEELGQLESLQTLVLSENQLTGNIPSSIGNLNNLISFEAESNRLNGALPPELGQLQRLLALYLRNNQLSGSIPSELGQMESLAGLQLQHNKLSGEIPTELGQLQNVIRIRLNNNELSGEIPASLGQMQRLSTLYLNNNQLSSCFADELLSLCRLSPIDNDTILGNYYNFTNNSQLPWQGDFQRFCNDEDQIGASCDDGNPNTTLDSINEDCECIGTSINTSTELTFYVEENDVEINGTEYIVPIGVLNFEAVRGFQFTLQLQEQFDNAIIDLVPTGVLDSINYYIIPDDSLQVTVLWEDLGSGGETLADSTHIFNLRLRINEMPQQCLPLSFSALPTDIVAIVAGETVEEFTPTTIDGEICVPETVQLAGCIKTEQGQPIKSVMVMRTDSELVLLEEKRTNMQGCYSFRESLFGQDYRIVPKHDTFPTNGVTVFDIVLIRDVILVNSDFDSPYQRIAADVNNSKNINVADIRGIRQLILTQTDRFPQNESWNFVPEFFDLRLPDNRVVAPDYEDQITLNNISNNRSDLDFIGVKTGDVNGTANTQLLTEGTFQVFMNDAYVLKGETTVLNLRAMDLAKLEGYQMEMLFNTKLLEFEDVIFDGLTDLDKSSFGFSRLDEGIISTLWYRQKAVESDVLFSLKFKAKVDTKLSKAFELKSIHIPAVAVTSDYRELDIGGTFLNKKKEARQKSATSQSGLQVLKVQPNPFESETTITFHQSSNDWVDIKIYNLSGQVLYQQSGYYEVGVHEWKIDGSSWSAGVYFCRVRNVLGSVVEKLILQK